MAKTRKKKTNPRIAPPKKRKTKLEKRRSDAAKKGWQTRRVNLIADANQAVAKIEKRLTESGENRALRIKLESVTKDRDVAQKALEEKWVPSDEDEWLHADGSIAMQPSRLRHGATGRKTRKSMIQIQRDDGENALRDFIRYWASEWDIPVQEFYTLLMSP